MISVSITDYSTIVAFWLAFTRLLPIITQLPVFDEQGIPVTVKVLTSVLVTFAFFPFIKEQIFLDINHVGLDHFWVLTIFNMVLGLAIGFIVKSIMNIFIGAGGIMTQQAGFAAMRFFDPNQLQVVGPFEKIIKWTIVVMILNSGALIPMFKGMFNSFFSIHIYNLNKLTYSSAFYFEFFKGMFLTSLLLAGPLIFCNLMVMTVLGVIARVVPQMNVLMISFVVNIGVGLFVFSMTSNEIFHVAYREYTSRLADWFHLLN